MLAQVLIIGGGTAGLAAAIGLAERRIFVNIVEKESSIGGMASELCCKGDIKCAKCDVCLSIDRLPEVAQSKYIRILTNSEVKRVSGAPGSYRVTVERKPQLVREDRCIACGACREVCPVEGSAINPRYFRSVPMTYYIDKNKCIRWKGSQCTKCAEICPNGAIDFDAPASKKYLNVSAIVVASGFEPFDATLDRRLGYGTLKNVLTSLEIERMINSIGKIVVFPTSLPCKKLAIIQCVGSRDLRMGASYCSKVCCKYALKIAQLAKLKNPDLEISFFLMDWRPYDSIDNELVEWANKNKGVKVIRTRPAEIIQSETDKPIVRYVSLSENTVEEEEFDLIMLSVGIMPPSDARRLSNILDMKISPHGFILDDGERRGIFAAGCCTGPKDIEESFMEGIATAGRVAAFIGGLK